MSRPHPATTSLRRRPRSREQALRQQLPDDAGRDAPRPRRIAISLRRAAALPSDRFAMFAHAIKRTSPMTTINTISGFE